MTIAIIMAIAEIFGLFMIGTFARRLGYINDNEIDRWSRLVLDFLLPAFMFTSIVKGLDIHRAHELWLLPVTGFLMVAFFTLIGMVLKSGLLAKNAKLKRTFLHLCAVNNSSFLPIIILRNLWGEGALANLFLLYVGTVIGIWTIGVGVLGTETTPAERFKKMISPNLVAIIAAILVASIGGTNIFPELAMRVLSSAGSSAPELTMLLIGASLAKRGILRISWPVAYMTIVRLCILPALMIPVLKLLPFSKDVYSVAVIVALMPTAVSSVIITRRYGGMPAYAASSALMTTVFSVITVPLAVWLLFK